MSDRALAAPRRLHAPRVPRLLVLLVAVLVVVGSFAVWLRDSSLVAVEDVTVAGVRGEQADEIRRALETAAKDMTTLHVRVDELRAAVARYPVVADVRATRDLPDGLAIEVVQRTPVAALDAGGRPVAVAGDGTLLRGTTTLGLPLVRLSTPPSGDRVADGSAGDAVTLLAAAPAALRASVARVYRGPRGMTARLSGGPLVYFGTPERTAAKWAALAAVLADERSRGASSIDVRTPERPAAAGLEQVSAQTPATELGEETPTQP